MGGKESGTRKLCGWVIAFENERGKKRVWAKEGESDMKRKGRRRRRRLRSGGSLCPVHEDN